jgi:hypothetical protein
MSAFLLCLSHFSTKILGLDRTVRFFAGAGRFLGARTKTVQTPEQRANQVMDAMTFLPLRLECLDQAIVTWYRLNRDGFPAVLNIGMRLSPLSGHAWVACGEQTFVRVPGMEDFTVVASYSAWRHKLDQLGP